ncbi:flagellar basal body-associated FliL family protein [Falsiroseomonas sp. CW058]|uniref:flagellar basal body-associated FliL family protein n=1 Tax=Falsiroseomonas sp. CW058 TaxID=3388664 RepID=UPI003D318875
MTEAAPEPKEASAKKGGKRLLLIGAAAVLLLGGGGVGAAWFLHLPPFSAPAPVAQAEAPAGPPVFVDIPDIVANLNASGRRQVFVRLRAKVEAPRPADAAAVQAAMPRLLDMFTTYLRETRPEELRGSAGTQRLREELLARANIATRPGAVTDILFVELVVQ